MSASTTSRGIPSIPLLQTICIAPSMQPPFLCGHAGMKETFATEALVKDIRAPVFKALLTYIYTDTLQLEKPEDIMELLVVANQVICLFYCRVGSQIARDIGLIQSGSILVNAKK